MDEEALLLSRGQLVGTRRGAWGRSRAATQPTRAKHPTTTMAVRNGGLPPAVAATSTEPAMATPRDDPRFDTLRETPEMSPWTSSGHADCTTLTDAVSMAPTPNPMRNKPGQKVQRSEEHTSELQSRQYLVCRLLLEKKNTSIPTYYRYDICALFVA